MSSSPLFKRAFVRGLNTELVRQGVVVYPSKVAADASADYVADNSGMPDPYLNGESLDMKIASELCEHLIKAAEFQCKEAGNQYSPGVTKTAQESTPVSLANADAIALLEKAAAETGSLVTGGNAPNDMPAAAQSNAEAALENAQRPENTANLGEDGVGNINNPSGGEVGTTTKAPNTPGATGGGSNSLTDKSASLASIVRRISGKTAADTGTLITGGDQPNTLPAAAVNNAEAALELSNRPEGYANVGEDGVGNTAMAVPSGAVVGREEPHPMAPMATDTGTNSVVEQTKNAFERLFEATAKQVVGYLPDNMADNQKVAHVRAMMGLEVPERAGYLQNLYSTLGATKEAAVSVRDHFRKTAEAEACADESKKEEAAEKAPSFPAAMMAKKEESKDEPKDEKTASVNTLSNLRARLKTLST